MIRTERWTSSAGLPLFELERQLTETLRDDYDRENVVAIGPGDRLSERSVPAAWPRERSGGVWSVAAS